MMRDRIDKVSVLEMTEPVSSSIEAYGNRDTYSEASSAPKISSVRISETRSRNGRPPSLPRSQRKRREQRSMRVSKFSQSSTQKGLNDDIQSKLSFSNFGSLKKKVTFQSSKKTEKPRDDHLGPLRALETLNGLLSKRGTKLKRFSRQQQRDTVNEFLSRTAGQEAFNIKCERSRS